MNGTIRLTVTGDLPDGLQVGDELHIEGTLTVHSVSAELIDVSSGAHKQYIAGWPDVEAYGNDLVIEKAREVSDADV